MKAKLMPLLIAGALLPLAATAQVTTTPLAQWDFTLASDDGKALTAIGGTGSAVGSNAYTFNRNLGSGSVIQNIAASGSPAKYALRLNGTGTESNTGVHTGITQRPTESFSLRVDIAGWDLSNATGTSTLLNFETRHDLEVGYPLGQLALGRKADGSIDLRLFSARATGGSYWQISDVAFNKTHGAMLIDLFYDMGASTLTLSYSVDGGTNWVEALSGLQFTGLVNGQERIPEYLFAVLQGRVGAGDYVDINSISLIPVPEPSTYALIGAALCLGFVAVKRRRSVVSR